MGLSRNYLTSCVLINMVKVRTWYCSFFFFFFYQLHKMFFTTLTALLVYNTGRSSQTCTSCEYVLFNSKCNSWLYYRSPALLDKLQIYQQADQNVPGCNCIDPTTNQSDHNAWCSAERRAWVQGEKKNGSLHSNFKLKVNSTLKCVSENIVGDK